MSPPRPFTVTLLALGVLTIAVLFLDRAFQAVRLWDFLSGLPLSVSPLYLALSGVVFGLAGLPVAWGLWRGRAWAPRWTRNFALALVVYYWLDRLWLVRAEVARVNTPFAVAATILALGFCYGALRRRRARVFFGEQG